MSREQLKSLIKSKGIAVYKLAQYADIHQDTLYNYLSGKTSISADTYELIEKILQDM